MILGRRVSGAGILVALLFPSVAVAQDPALVEQGELLYADQRCRICHSIGDDGNKKGPLDGVGSRLTSEELELWLLEPKVMTEKAGATRKPDMPAYPQLSEREIDALVAYMLGL